MPLNFWPFNRQPKPKPRTFRHLCDYEESLRIRRAEDAWDAARRIWNDAAALTRHRIMPSLRVVDLKGPEELRVIYWGIVGEVVEKHLPEDCKKLKARLQIEDSQAAPTITWIERLP